MIKVRTSETLAHFTFSFLKMKVPVWENNRKTKEIKGKEQRELNQTGTEPSKSWLFSHRTECSLGTGRSQENDLENPKRGIGKKKPALARARQEEASVTDFHARDAG